MSAIIVPQVSVISDPDILDGEAVVAGTRISVALILRELSMGISHADLIRSYPTLTEKGIHSALAYAADLVGDVRTFHASE